MPVKAQLGAVREGKEAVTPQRALAQRQPPACAGAEPRRGCSSAPPRRAAAGREPALRPRGAPPPAPGPARARGPALPQRLGESKPQ